jgi:hypothetical protein
VKLYSINVKICATAYIKAESEEEAMDILLETVGDGKSQLFGEDDIRGVIDGSTFSSDMDDFTLSPAITYYGVYDDDETLQLVEEFDDEDEDEEEEDE